MRGESMDRGMAGARRPPGGAHLGRLAALALVLVAFAALPLAAAEPGPVPLLPPAVSDVRISPNPVLPGLVSVLATASSTAIPPRYVRFLVDSPSNATYHFMYLVNPPADALTEEFGWSGQYGEFGPGWHRLYVHASEDRVMWGLFDNTLVFRAEEPTTYGPVATAMAATPEVPRGAPIVIRATFVDSFAEPPWNSSVAEAEFFIDRFLGDGNGTPLDGTYGLGVANVSWTGDLELSPATHTVLVHARNVYGMWGPLTAAPFVARTPTFTLRVEADRETAERDEAVAYTVDFTNAGNADAISVFVNVTLPARVAFVTAAPPYDTANGATYGWRFPTVVPGGGGSIAITTTVLIDAADGASLDAWAALDYTNDQDWNFTEVSAHASASVIAAELAVTWTGPGVAYAGETATLTLTIEHTGFRTIPSVDVVVDDSPWTETVTGPIGPLTDVEPGSHPIDITERIVAGALDGLQISRSVEISYTSRFGEPVPLQPPPHVLNVARPSLALRVESDREWILAGDRIGLSVELANSGSVAAGEVRLTVSLPRGLSLVGGDAPTISSGDERAWILEDVGASPATLSLVVEGKAAGTYALSFRMDYTSPNGVPLDTNEYSLVVVVRNPSPVGTWYAALTAAGAAAMVGGFLATERGKTAFFFLFIPLYTRLQRAHVLDHETRGMIRGYILANPGDHYNSIKGALELPNGTLAYHLQVLEKEMLVKSVKDGKFRRFYPYEMRMPEGGEPTKVQKVIVDLIRANPGITPRDAASLLGLTSSTVSYHLERLEELALVEHRREGISKRLYAKGDLDA